MKIKLMTFLFLIFLVNLTYSDYFHGNDLIKLMDDSKAQYAGYVAGVQDSYNGVRFCVPPKVKLSQAMAIVSKYIKAHPKRWHEAAKLLVIDALIDAFPCNKSHSGAHNDEEAFP